MCCCHPVLKFALAKDVYKRQIKYSEVKTEAVMKKKSATGIFSFFAQVFTPLIPVFAGAGLIFGVMKVLTLVFNMTGMPLFDPASSSFMFAVNVLASTFFTYLNIAVAMSAARVMGGNPYPVSYTHLGNVIVFDKSKDVLVGTVMNY